MEHVPGKVKFLVCVDTTDECKVALKFACMRAKNSGGSVLLLYVIEPKELQHFAGIEKIMVKEAKEEAKNVLAELAESAMKDFNLKVQTVTSNGKKYNQIVDLINKDKSISILVLGEAPDGMGSNDLINKFTAGLTRSINIPLTIVPGNLSIEDLEKIT
ncbi:MAG: universal stress protein UspA [Rickettsiales bacterium]|nr:universal stress protein UspA [Rickettsiales bacterium]|tara:strand:- start:1752 stop:2228 length:477 start_codon:yes stop_codon:yes gene_type:complete